MKWICILFVCGLLTPLAIAQGFPAVRQVESACGPNNVKFDVDRSADQHPLPAALGNGSEVFVIEDSDGLTMRVGLDGRWVGADNGKSYLPFPVTAGEHHLCVNWQSKFKRLASIVSLYKFNAQPTHTYYFRVQSESERNVSGGGSTFPIDLEPVNPDEAKLLIATYPIAISTVHK